jgi:hypothetical protein
VLEQISNCFIRGRIAELDVSQSRFGDDGLVVAGGDEMDRAPECLQRPPQSNEGEDVAAGADRHQNHVHARVFDVALPQRPALASRSYARTTPRPGRARASAHALAGSSPTFQHQTGGVGRVALAAPIHASAGSSHSAFETKNFSAVVWPSLEISLLKASIGAKPPSGWGKSLE